MVYYNCPKERKQRKGETKMKKATVEVHITETSMLIVGDEYVIDDIDTMYNEIVGSGSIEKRIAPSMILLCEPFGEKKLFKVLSNIVTKYEIIV